METRPTCHVFLADDAVGHEVLTVYCKAPEYTREQAVGLVAADLAQHHPGAQYDLLYMGIIDFHELDQAIIDRQDELFEIRTPVWVTKNTYAG